MECGSYLWKEAGKRLHFLRNSRDTEEEGVRGWVLILGKRAVSQLEMATIRVSVTWWITEPPHPPPPVLCKNRKCWRKSFQWDSMHECGELKRRTWCLFIIHSSRTVLLPIPHTYAWPYITALAWRVPFWLAESMVWPVDVPAVSGHWKKNPESHHIHIKKKMLSNSCLFGFLFKLISICASFQILLHIIPQSPSIDCCSPWSTLHSGFGVLFLSEFALINNTFNQWRLVTSFCTPFHLNRGVTPDQNPWRQDLSSCTVVHFLSSLEFSLLLTNWHCTVPGNERELSDSESWSENRNFIKADM